MLALQGSVGAAVTAHEESRLPEVEEGIIAGADLIQAVRRSGVKAREIMVWGPRSTGLLNACVLGGWARFRYVLISPALADELGPEETEAVLAHELGHARYGHLAFLFMMILCLSALLNPVLDLLPQNWRNTPFAEAGALISLVGAYMYFFYGTVMRQCEREADLASAELMGTPAPSSRRWRNWR